MGSASDAARRAIAERRHIVTELIPMQSEPFNALMDAMLAIGYKISSRFITCDPEVGWQRNVTRGDDNISCVYAEPYQIRWLLDAAQAALPADAPAVEERSPRTETPESNAPGGSEPLTQAAGNEQRIHAALVALMENYAKSGSVILIEEPRSRKFVQFGPGWQLVMDVPLVALNAEEADRAYRFFTDLGEEYPHEYNAPDPSAGVVRHGATFNHDFDLDAHRAARAAVDFFQKVCLIGPDSELAIRQL